MPKGLQYRAIDNCLKMLFKYSPTEVLFQIFSSEVKYLKLIFIPMIQPDQSEASCLSNKPVPIKMKQIFQYQIKFY